MSEKTLKIDEATRIIYLNLKEKMTFLKNEYTMLEIKRNNILQQMAKTQEDLSAIQRMIHNQGIYIEIEKNIETEEKDLGENISSALFIEVKEPISPTEYIEKIFKLFPNKKFDAPELRTQLELLSKLGMLKTHAKNYLWAIHSSLKTLITRGIISKSEDGKFYKKINEIEKLKIETNGR